MPAPNDDLAALVDTPEGVTIGGKALVIGALKVGQLPAFLRAARPILDTLAGGDILAVLLAHPDSAIEAIAIASGQPRVWLDGLETDDLVLLGGKCLEVNADFFVRRLAPRIQTVSERLSGLLAGLNLPNGSSGTATGTAM